MNGELVEYLDKKFNKIEQDIGEIKSDVKEVKTDVGINKTNIFVNFKEAKGERASIKTKIDETYNAVDGFIKIVTKLETEFTALKEDLKRVKDVIREKLGVDLT